MPTTTAATTGVDDAAKKAAQLAELANSKRFGKWEEPFSIENVACHATLLPNGLILCWSRRSNPMSPTASMDEQRTNAFLVDVKKEGGVQTPRCRFTKNQPQSFGFVPQDTMSSDISLFCSGHCLQADGNLFVVGGHITDGHGKKQACVYDYSKDLWSAKTPPNAGRWYPSMFTLPDSSVLAISGLNENNQLDQQPQIWRNDGWERNFVQSLSDLPDERKAILAPYPRLHTDPSGQVFMAGPGAQSLFLDVNAGSGTNIIGRWGLANADLKREAQARENGASVTYDVGKVLWIGGGNEFNDKGQAFGPPTDATEIIDLNVKNPKWQVISPGNLKRRHHNLTTLPDGTVLVTGGTRGSGFNDLTAGMPVHAAEIWNPVDQKWTKMAEESTDRCYHGVALLLPDGSVFSAGSGEGGEFDAPPNPLVPNPARDNHTNAQIYKPPYFFVGDAPQVTGAPKQATYGTSFDVNVQGSDLISRISWIRLPSVTHGVNSSQSVFFEVFTSPKGGKITVTPPKNSNIASPGHYMLFFLSKQGRPSEAAIIQLLPDQSKTDQTLHTKSEVGKVADGRKFTARMTGQSGTSLPQLDEAVIAGMDKPAVKVGITPVCPYGLGACWAGAFEGLQRIDDIDVVRPLPDNANSVAFVYLKEGRLPDIDAWRRELAQTAGGTYDLRGIEMTLTGTVTKSQASDGDKLVMHGTSTRLGIIMNQFEATSKLERDHKVRKLMPVYDHELSAYESLYTIAAGKADGVMVKATGRLHKHGVDDYSLDVKEFEVLETS